MHLAAFVDDVAAADHRLTVHADGPTAERRRTLADALPGAAVDVEPGHRSTPASLGRLDDGSLVLSMGSTGTGLLVGADLSLDRPTSNPSRPLGAVDETTFTVQDGSRAFVDTATRAVASLAAEVDTLHLGLGQSLEDCAVGETAHVYGGDGTAEGATQHAATSGELAEARFAVVDAADPGRGAALLCLPTEAGFRGFLSVRSALVDDLAGYLTRRYARGTTREASPRRT